MPSLPPPKKNKFSTFVAKFAKVRFFAISLVVHVALFAMLGSIVLFGIAQTKPPFVSSEEYVLPPSDDAQEPSEEPADFAKAEFANEAESNSGNQSSLSASSLQSLSTFPSVLPASSIVDIQTYGSTFGANRIGTISPHINDGGGATTGAGQGWGKTSGKGSWTQGFGSSVKDDMKLVGNLYDLKKDKKGKSLSVDYWETVAQLVESRFNPAVLKDFYISKNLYASQIYLPQVDATEGPKAFGLERVVEPRNWFVHYRGGFSPPKSGKYRFWSKADDTVIVAVNKKVVLDVTWGPNPSKWQGRDNARVDRSKLFPGDWMTLEETQTYRLDIIVGEQPGGEFWGYLVVEADGEKYEQSAEGEPILPIFSTLPIDKIRNSPDGLKILDKPLVMTPKRKVVEDLEQR